MRKRAHTVFFFFFKNRTYKRNQSESDIFRSVNRGKKKSFVEWARGGREVRFISRGRVYYVAIVDHVYFRKNCKSDGKCVIRNICLFFFFFVVSYLNAYAIIYIALEKSLGGRGCANGVYEV